MARLTRRLLLAGLLAGTTGSAAGCRPRSEVRTAKSTVHRYGDHPRQVGELHLPTTGSPRGVVALLHGGFWRADYDRSLQADVAADLVAAGYAVWNLEYRPVGDGGGWPHTFTDVAAGIDLLADLAPDHGLPIDKVVTVGHSAGGTLAMWAAARPGLPDAAPGAVPRVVPAAACSQAGVLDLVAGALMDLGNGAVLDLMGVPNTRDPARYALASPVLRLPYGVPLLAVSGTRDDVVPPALSEGFAAVAAKQGDAVRLELVDGEGHFEHLDPSSRCWRAVRSWLDDVLPARAP